MFLTSEMGRSSIRPWGPRSPHEVQSRRFAFHSFKRMDGAMAAPIRFQSTNWFDLSERLSAPCWLTCVDRTTLKLILISFPLPPATPPTN